MKQAVILSAILVILAQCVSADEINVSNHVEDEDVPPLKIESLSNVRLSQVDGDRFIVSLLKMNWFSAYVFCSQQNATLLSLELGSSDIKKPQFIEFLNFYHIQSRPYWLNANRLEDDITFLWGLGGLPLSYTDWNPGEPNNLGGNQRCIKVFPAMTWDDDDCFSQYYAACQKN